MRTDSLRSRASRALAWTGAGLFVLLVAGIPDASAQQEPELIDQIVAVVGDTTVTQSELIEYVFQLQTQQIQVPRDPEACDRFVQQVVDQKVNDLLLMVHAQRAGITIPESQIDAQVDQRLSRIRNQFPSDLGFQQALADANMTPAEFRIQLKEQTRADMLTQRYVQQRMSGLQPTPVSEEEIRERFEQQRASLGRRPATVSLKQVIVRPQPTEDARLVAVEKAERALSRARSGEDFAKLAREFSEDPASRESGGELGWVNRDDVLRPFADALFSMKVGEISGIVESSVGYHIIKLERVRGSERFARHILIRPELTQEDRERARALAEEIASALREGADPDSLIDLHHDPEERAVLTEWPQNELPEAYRDAFQGAEAGDVIGPFRVDRPGLAQGKWVVAELDEVRAGGAWTLEDARDLIRRQIQQEKALSGLVEDLRESTYVDFRTRPGCQLLGVARPGAAGG